METLSSDTVKWMVGLIPSVVGTCYAVQIKTPEALVEVVVVMALWARGFSQTVVGVICWNDQPGRADSPPPPKISYVLSPYHTTCSG